MIVLPKTKHRLGKVVLITERAHPCRAQQKIFARGSGAKPYPSGSKNSNEVSAGKEQYISRDRPATLSYTVRPLADLCWRFASRGAVGEQLPVWMSCKDLG